MQQPVGTPPIVTSGTSDSIQDKIRQNRVVNRQPEKRVQIVDEWDEETYAVEERVEVRGRTIDESDERIDEPDKGDQQGDDREELGAKTRARVQNFINSGKKCKRVFVFSSNVCAMFQRGRRMLVLRQKNISFTKSLKIVRIFGQEESIDLNNYMKNLIENDLCSF